MLCVTSWLCPKGKGNVLPFPLSFLLLECRCDGRSLGSHLGC